MAETGPDYEALKQQIEQHTQLQQDLEQQQRVVDALSNMVVVVDESSPESGMSFGYRNKYCNCMKVFIPLFIAVLMV